MIAALILKHGNKATGFPVTHTEPATGGVFLHNPRQPPGGVFGVLYRPGFHCFRFCRIAMINGVETQNIVLHLCGRADKGFIKPVDRSPSRQHPVKVAYPPDGAGNAALKAVKI
ncbi:Uncharacterised protein [Shigella sonnei]|nr:Uncharacterised protein [Shigella sonnei]CSF07603.1 Uncharacterised protein [Shigella sonnei]CSF08544.1 Uncharacterised protein [Shigella sonnei]CSF16507.1 Uncharacterised protein [Shigella sonnei]CSF24665.1 Uncharacterised protein [Shigella sonnei]